MRNDNYRIGLIYEELRSDDIFSLTLEELNNYDWDIFFNSEYCGLYSTVLLESFTKIIDNVPSKVGLLDQYEILLYDGSKFTLNINYNDANQIRKLSNAAIIDADIKNRSDIVDGYQHFKHIKDGQYVALIEFKDSQNRHTSTGEVGPHAHELFSMLKNAVSHSLSQNNMMNNTVGIMMLVNNNEPKRLILYWKILERLLKNTFPIIFKDDNSKSLANVTILVAIK